jgi:hypothetical protein
MEQEYASSLCIAMLLIAKLTGTERNKRILIPRINLTYSGTILLFNFQRSQFPIIAAFTITK